MSSDDKVKSGVGVIVVKGTKILAGRRIGSHGAGALCFPGGHIELNDKSMKTCGEREVFEETGIICDVISIDGHREELFTTYDILSENKDKRYVTPYLLAKYLYGGDQFYDEEAKLDAVAPNEPDKCECWHWYSLEELSKTVYSDPQSKVWIPINQVIYYLTKYWNTNA